MQMQRNEVDAGADSNSLQLFDKCSALDAQHRNAKPEDEEVPRVRVHLGGTRGHFQLFEFFQLSFINVCDLQPLAPQIVALAKLCESQGSEQIGHVELVS